MIVEDIYVDIYKKEGSRYLGIVRRDSDRFITLSIRDDLSDENVKDVFFILDRLKKIEVEKVNHIYNETSSIIEDEYKKMLKGYLGRDAVNIFLDDLLESCINKDKFKRNKVYKKR